MHFIEFDDHGWTYPDTGFAGPNERVGNPSRQLDCAMADLAAKVREGPTALYLYVHGWHHNAGSGDSDIKKFQDVLDGHTSSSNRSVVGFFIGWEGATIRQPFLKDLTFQTRKNAAHRVAAGRIRELFARIKGLRQHYNSGADGSDCETPSSGQDQCRLRTIMMGHSFGGLILYSAIEPYLLETLSVVRDLPAASIGSSPRSQGIADLVVLLNPAFEATLFEPIHRMAQQYQRLLPADSKKPLMVSITSRGDYATGKLFPIARQITTLFEYPATSDLQSEALRDTVGNVAAYLTHTLCLEGGSCSRGDVAADPSEMPVTICGDLKLFNRMGVKGTPPVWNVYTYKDIIKDHNAITDKKTVNFFQWVYALNTGREPPCLAGADESVPETTGK